MSSNTSENATLFNLISYEEKLEGEQSNFSTLLSVILKKFPVHLIKITEQAADLKTPPVIKKDDDTLNLELDHKELSLAPFYILPSLISDLPIYLLWGEDPINEKLLFPMISKWSKRLIFECGLPLDLATWGSKILDLIKSTNLDIVDVNWTRTVGWRAVLSQICDCPNRLKAFRECYSLKIYYNHSSSIVNNHSEIQALYLQAWLSVSLDWKCNSIKKEGGAFHLQYQTENGPLVVDLIQVAERDIPSGEILKIEMSCPNEESFSIKYKENSQVIVYASTRELCLVPFTLPLLTIKKEQQFVNELFYKPVSSHYIHLLQWMINYGSL
jgi:hypothetical protein